jgi:hypothetical protein
MLKSIRTRTPLTVIDGVLIKRHALHTVQTHDSLIAQAQRHARTIVARADSEADAIRQYAAARGYREGLRDAWQSITPWVNAFERHCAQALDAFEREIHARLHAALHDQTVVAFVVQRIFEGIGHTSTRQIRILVPASMSGLLSSFSEWAAQAGLAHVIVTACEDDRLTVECGDDIYLFDMKARAGEWGTRLSAPEAMHTTGPSAGPLSPGPNAQGRHALASIDTDIIRQSETARREAH